MVKTEQQEDEDDNQAEDDVESDEDLPQALGVDAQEKPNAKPTQKRKTCSF